MPLYLSDIPTSGAELEDYVAALFLAAGCFVEKNIEERNVLELDIVATDYTQDTPRVVLAEAKSGDWGFGDLFKVVGWMRYLRIDEGAMLVREIPHDKDLDRLGGIFGPLSVTIVRLDDLEEASNRFAESGLPVVRHPQEVEQWRWVHTAERVLLRQLIALKKSQLDRQGPSAVAGYHELVNNGIFFEPSIAGRLSHLYEAYQTHPKLALGCALEMDDDPFDPNPFFKTSPRMSDAMLRGEHSLLQASFYVEHRARLAILKPAVDLACRAPRVVDKLVGRTTAFRTGVPTLPASFVEGLRWLTEQPTFRHYPRLWQMFLWSWGGFVLRDREDVEYGWLSDQSGVPKDEVAAALQAFDYFYPIEGSWFATPGPTHCKMIKMMPWAFLGLGSHHRLTAYGLTDYVEFGYSDYTATDMARWHLHAYELLSSSPAASERP